MDIQHQQNFEGKVSLPFNQDQFTDFLVSLLGKPQTISKDIRGSFDITKDDIVSIFEVLNQRIFQQNEASLLQFTSVIHYADRSSVTLNGYDHLVNYNENLPVVSRGLHLTWVYLVKFRDKKTPEKQEINVSFITENGHYLDSEGEYGYHRFNNYVNIRIAHTARTWGADIESILSKRLHSMVKKPSKLFDYLAYEEEKLSLIITIVMFAITASFFVPNFINAQNSIPANDMVKWSHYHFFTLLLIVGTYLFARVVELVLKEVNFDGSPSFITFNHQSEKFKQKMLNSYRRRIAISILKAIISVALGIVGNIMYDQLILK